MKRIENQPAYVLHSRPFKETSALVEIFTPEYGRFSVVAKGARRPKSAWKGLLQLFVPIWISCAGKGELLNLYQAEQRGPGHFFSGNKLLLGFYCNELIMRLTHRFDAHKDIFTFYQDTLAQFKSEDLSEHIILRLFEKALLKAIGYELPLNRERNTEEDIVEHQQYFFDPMLGARLSSGYGGNGVSSAISAGNFGNGTSNRSSASPTSGSPFEILVQGKSLLALRAENFSDHSTFFDVKRILRAALKVHLGQKTLETRRLFVKG